MSLNPPAGFCLQTMTIIYDSSRTFSIVSKKRKVQYTRTRNCRSVNMPRSYPAQLQELIYLTSYR